LLAIGPDLVATAKKISQEITMSALPLTSFSSDVHSPVANHR